MLYKFDKIIRKVVGILPQKLQKIYYDHESAWLYIFFGGLTTLVSIAAQYICIYLGAGTALATTVSWICAVTFAFFTNKVWVFRSESFEKKIFIREFLGFYGARLVSYFLELGFLLLTVDMLGCNSYLMKLIAQVFVLVINYLFSRFVIFVKKDNSDKNTTNT